MTKIINAEQVLGWPKTIELSVYGQPEILTFWSTEWDNEATYRMGANKESFDFVMVKRDSSGNITHMQLFYNLY